MPAIESPMQSGPCEVLATIHAMNRPELVCDAREGYAGLTYRMKRMTLTKVNLPIEPRVCRGFFYSRKIIVGGPEVQGTELIRPRTSARIFRKGSKRTCFVLYVQPEHRW